MGHTIQKTEIGEDGLVLSLPENHSWIAQVPSRHLYVRQCCSKLYQHLVTLKDAGNKGAVITGNPGIGKSWFLNYLLFKWITDKKGRVYFQSQEEQMSWLFSEEGVSVVYHPQLLEADDLYLFDPAEKGSGQPVKSNAFTIIASSPDKSHYSVFLNRVQIKLFLPVWKWEEIEPLCTIPGFLPEPINKDIAQERFNIFGGILRYILSENREKFLTWYGELQSAASNSTVQDIRSLGPAGLDMSKEASHKLFHIFLETQESFQSISIRFASPSVEDMVYEHLAHQQLDDLFAFVREDSLPSIASLRLTFFEKFVHAAFSKGGTFKVRCLSHYSEETELTIPDNLPCVSKVDCANLKDNHYYRPPHKNFPVVDSLANGVIPSVVFK